jgi:hypothetical protein
MAIYDRDTPEEMRKRVDPIAYMLEQEGHSPILFRSSGGKGIHLYLLWDQPQDAYSVRVMLTELLAFFELKPGTGGVAKGQVEVYPKQDAVPADGFGSMFILPFAGKSELLE